MSDDNAVKSSRDFTTLNSPHNVLSYGMEKAMSYRMNTAIPVRVDEVFPGKTGPAGRVTVTPLVLLIDSYHQTLPQSQIFEVPYSRIQGGVAAVIIDPQPGDLGWVVFCKQDISLVKTGITEPVQPGSYRTFDTADAIYLGGILNQAPSIWLELTQEGVATLHAPTKIVLDTPLVEVTGRVESVEDQVAGTVSQMEHTHSEVVRGSDSTGKPNQ